jgi:hypothetical protein
VHVEIQKNVWHLPEEMAFMNPLSKCFNVQKSDAFSFILFIYFFQTKHFMDQQDIICHLDCYWEYSWSWYTSESIKCLHYFCV